MPLSADDAFNLLENAWRRDRLGHAWLITGPEGCGKRGLVTRLCDLLVPGKGQDPLQRPDVHVVQPESKARRIVIEQMRDLEGVLRMRAAAGGRKVGVIFDADRLQPQASNAFLKTLEEPPAKTHLLLVTALPDQLLETILSRCIEIALVPTVKRALTPRQEELLGVLERATAKGALDLPGTFGLVRDFQRLLGAAKEEAQEAGEAELKAEEKRYKQIADAKYFEEREDYFKALGEARYLGERSGLLEVLEQWWADVLRQQSGSGEVEYPAVAAATGALAQRLSTAEALQRSAALEKLREQLANAGVQEPLALEVAFLQAFGE